MLGVHPSTELLKWWGHCKRQDRLGSMVELDTECSLEKEDNTEQANDWLRVLSNSMGSMFWKKKKPDTVSVVTWTDLHSRESAPAVVGIHGQQSTWWTLSDIQKWNRWSSLWEPSGLCWSHNRKHERAVYNSWIFLFCLRSGQLNSRSYYQSYAQHRLSEGITSLCLFPYLTFFYGFQKSQLPQMTVKSLSSNHLQYGQWERRLQLPVTWNYITFNSTWNS